MYRSTLKILGIIYVGVTAASFSTSNWAGCLDSDPDAAFVAVIDATTSCSAINGQFGCSIDDGEGTCTATDPNDLSRTFTVHSTVGANGASWILDPDLSNIGVDTALVGGASQGNACGYSYQYDTNAGTGGFLKSNGSISNINYVDICSDGLDQIEPPAPPEPTVLPACNVLTDGNSLPTIDDTGVQCPDDASRSIVCNFELSDVDGEPVPFFGLNDADSCCVCDQLSVSLEECDPSIPENTNVPVGSPGPCPIPDPGIPNTEVTSFIELNNDPYFCRTVAGRRTCYYY